MSEFCCKRFIGRSLRPKSNGNLTKIKEYKGISAHLFAIAAKISFDEGYDGYVQAQAANREVARILYL